jgi:predicted MFS family arabinose efflux permease
MTPGLLLLFTFALGTGAAFLAPAWQSVVPSLVPRAALTQAVALNSLGVNLSRAVGPAIGGAVLASLGAAWPFLLNAMSFAGVIGALLWWRPPPAPERRLPPEGLAEAMIGGLRYAAASTPLKATLLRAVLFFLFASAYWALLPLIVRDTLAGGPGLYGLLFGAVGAGAVLGALALPRLKQRLSGDRLVALGSAGTAVTLGVFALTAHPAAALAASLLAGASWITVLSNLNVSAQTALPDWVRARGLALFITVFYGAMSAGALLWGDLAARFGIPAALLVAAAGLLLGLPLATRFRLQQGATLDLSPSMHWPEPVVLSGSPERRGPVLVTVEYPVAPGNEAAFLALMHRLAAERRRDGAWGWSLQEDTATPGLWLETFREADWTAHLRHHARVTVADRAVQEDIRTLLRHGAAPLVRHFLGPARAQGDPR